MRERARASEREKESRRTLSYFQPTLFYCSSLLILFLSKEVCYIWIEYHVDACLSKAQVDTYPRSIAAELRCNVVAVEASAGARFHETVKETNHVVTVWWSGSIARKDAPYVQLKTKWMLNNNLAAGSLATKLIPEHAIFLSLTSANIKHKGTAMGTPFSHDKKLMWFAIEHPLAVNGILQSDPDKAVCAVVYLAELEPGIPSQQVSVVIGVSHHKVQLRRSFLGYLAETRAAPSRPFTHYNSWFDFASWQEPNATFHYRIMNEAICS